VGVWRNEEKYREYSKRFNYHDTGDVAVIQDWYVKIVGRSDDMIKVAGHRITSGEVEAVVGTIPGVKDVSAVGVPDSVKGEKLVIFVVGEVDEELIKDTVREKLGPIYVVDKVIKVPRMPKSRSGKVVRRILRDLTVGKEVDPTILEDPEVVVELKDALRKGGN